MFKAFLAAVIGSVIAFMWSWVSWSVLPFHGKALNQFSNEAAVVEALKTGVSEPGIYIIPGDQSLSEEAKMEAMKNGPFVFASVRVGADEDFSMGKSILRGFTATLVAGIILAILLGAVAPRLNYIGRVFYVIMIAVFVGIAGIYPNQIWWEFSTGHVLWNMLDVIIGWGVAALIMAAMINGRSPDEAAE